MSGKVYASNSEMRMSVNNWASKAELEKARRVARKVYAHCLSMADDDGNYAHHSAMMTALGRAGEILDTYGTEYMDFDLGRGKSYGLYYCNTGDTYLPTVAFNPVKRRFRILRGGWGEIAERELRRGRNQ